MHTILEPSSRTRQSGARFFSVACAQLLPGVLLLLFTANFLSLFALQISRFPLLTEAGYGDSYILWDTLHFLRTGVIYRDLSQPPYLPAQYSPLVYMLYAIPAGISGVNSFFGPRLLAFAVFVLCIAVVVSMVRELVPVRSAWLWGLLLAGSIRSMEMWPLQIRGDFPGILFALISIRLLMVRSSWVALLLAGLCAGLAFQFKITYVAALAAGALWLLLRRQFKGLGIFLAAGGLTSVGLYLIFWLWEPRMISQMLALAPGIPDVKGCLKLALSAAKEPVALLALPGLPLVVSRRWPRWMLVVLYVSFSAIVGGFADIQAGGNINYFFEPLFALTPLAVFGIYNLIHWCRPRSGLALLATGLLLIQFVFPTSAFEMRSQLAEINPRPVISRLAVNKSNAEFRRLEAALRGRHIFTTIPRIALLDPEPVLLEPYLLTYSRRLGKFDPQPYIQKIRHDEFDVILTGVGQTLNWRGIRFLDDGVRAAIFSAYKPACIIKQEEVSVYLPRMRPADAALLTSLRQAGCVPLN